MQVLVDAAAQLDDPDCYVGGRVYVGSNAAVLPDVRFGPCATVGAASMIAQDVPTIATALGVPGRSLMLPFSHPFPDEIAQQLERASPTDDSPILANISKAQKLLHLRFEVRDLDVALEAARRSGYHQIRDLTTTKSLGDRRHTWVFSTRRGLFELLEA